MLRALIALSLVAAPVAASAQSTRYDIFLATQIVG
jgi:hypothetical protein